MSGSSPVPAGFRFERLSKPHDRRGFSCGNVVVDRWLRESARQSQSKHLTVTEVLTDGQTIASFYTLAPGTVALHRLPPAVIKRLPDHPVPIITLAWLGVAMAFAGRRLGTYTFIAALRHCLSSMRDLGGVAVIIDCLDRDAAAFYDRFQFPRVPGYPLKRVISRQHLTDLLDGDDSRASR